MFETNQTLSQSIIVNMTILKRCRPLLFVSENQLLLYKQNRIYLYNLDSEKFEYLVSFEFSVKYFLFDSIPLFSRLLRLNSCNAVLLDDNHVLLVFNKSFYELDLQKKSLSIGMPVSKGSRPLNMVRVEGVEGVDDGLYYGEYFDNVDRGEVFVKQILAKDRERIVYTFPPNTIYHVHNLLPDKNNQCVWVFTGDLDNESGIWKATNNFSKVEPVKIGSQLYRACVAFIVPEGILYATDSQEETNYICLLYEEDGEYKVRKIQEISGPVIYGTKYRDGHCFSTTVEPAIVKKYSRKEMLRYLLTLKKGKGVKDYKSHLYLGSLKNGFRDVYSAKKDLLPMGLFQFGALTFPGTNNFFISKLVLYQIATVRRDMDTVFLVAD